MISGGDIFLHVGVSQNQGPSPHSPPTLHTPYLGSPLGYLTISLMALKRGPIY